MNTTSKKRYTVYKFPSLWGTPKHFRFYFTAWLYAFLNPGICYELMDNETGKYKAYWQ